MKRFLSLSHDTWFCKKCNIYVKKSEWLKHKQEVHNRYLNTDSIESEQYQKYSSSNEKKDYWVCAIHKNALDGFRCSSCDGSGIVIIRRSYYNTWFAEMQKKNDHTHQWISKYHGLTEWFDFSCLLCDESPQDVGFYSFRGVTINHHGEIVVLEVVT